MSEDRPVQSGKTAEHHPFRTRSELSLAGRSKARVMSIAILTLECEFWKNYSQTWIFQDFTAKDSASKLI
jgi:hypothetical protein